MVAVFSAAPSRRCRRRHCIVAVVLISDRLTDAAISRGIRGTALRGANKPVRVQGGLLPACSSGRSQPTLSIRDSKSSDFESLRCAYP